MSYVSGLVRDYEYIDRDLLVTMVINFLHIRPLWGKSSHATNSLFPSYFNSHLHLLQTTGLVAQGRPREQKRKRSPLLFLKYLQNLEIASVSAFSWPGSVYFAGPSTMSNKSIPSRNLISNKYNWQVVHSHNSAKFNMYYDRHWVIVEW